MMRRTTLSTELRLMAILLAAVLAFAAGCASTPPPPVEEPEDTSEFDDAAAMTPPMEEVVETTVAVETISIPPIYFDFDEYAIKSDYDMVLQNAAMGLRETGISVTIEGHTDDRGSDEYNLALGERRAGAVRRYLLDLGVDGSQITTISYGESRPAVSGTGETVWQLNRRAEFQIR